MDASVVAPRSPHGPLQVSARLLLVDPHPAPHLVADLAAAGCGVTTCADGLSGLTTFGAAPPQPVLFGQTAWDRMGATAADVVRTLRGHGASLVMVSGLAGAEQEHAGVVGMDVPLSAAAVLAVLHGHAGASGADALVVGPLRLEPQSLSVWLAGARLPDLPPKEFTLLTCLMRHYPAPLPDEVLRRTLWEDGEKPPSDNTVAVHVARLRHRLGERMRIRRLRGRGYLLTGS